MEKELRAALLALIYAIENSDAGWNGIDAFPEDFYPLLKESEYYSCTNG